MSTNGHIMLSDLGEVVSEVFLIRPDGKRIALTLRTLSEQETFEVKASLSWPVPKPKLFAKITNPGRPNHDQVVQVPDPTDAEYAKAMDEANRLYVYRLLAHAIVMEGLPDDLNERASLLQKTIGAWAYNQLLEHLGRFTGITQAEVEGEAENFPPQN